MAVDTFEALFRQTRRQGVPGPRVLCVNAQRQEFAAREWNGLSWEGPLHLEPAHRVLERVMHVNPQPPVHEMPELNVLTSLIDQGQGDSPRAGLLMEQLLNTLGQGHDHLQKLQRSLERQRHLRTMTQG